MTTMKKDETPESNPDLAKPNSSSIGAPPDEVTTTAAPPVAPVIDTTQAAVTVTTDMANLAAKAVGVPVFTEADVIDTSGAALPSAAYGDFVEKVGLAVAKAQSALDKNSVEAAQLLAEKEIDALIALNQVIDENGKLVEVKPEVHKMKLISFIRPAFYQWSRVTLFARFNVSKFEVDGSTQISSSVSASSSSRSFGGGLSGGLAGGLFSLGGSLAGSRGSSSVNSSSNTDVNTDFETANSSGTSSMLAVLEPRTDILFPAPLITTQSPSFRITSTSNTLAKPIATDTDATPDPTSLDLDIKLSKEGGFFSSKPKIADLALDGPGLLSASSITLSGSGDTLSATVKLSRRLTDTAGTATVRAKLGSLTSSVAIQFT